MAVVRTENWTQPLFVGEQDTGMLSTVVVEVHESELVRVAQPLWDDLGLDPSQATTSHTDVPPWDTAWAAFPYTYVGGRLTALGWTRGDDS